MRCKACDRQILTGKPTIELCSVCNTEANKYHDLTNYSYPDEKEGEKPSSKTDNNP